MIVGENLLQARKLKKLSQRELGDLVGVSGAIIGLYEKGVRSPRPATLQQLAKILDVDKAWLETGDDPDRMNQYKIQFDSIMELVNLMQQSEKERRFLNNYARLTWALTELNRALQDQRKLGAGEVSEKGELDALRRIEIFAKSCCDYFTDLQSAYPDGASEVRKRFNDWQKEKQKFDSLLIEYNKLNANGRKIIVNTMTALAATPEYQISVEQRKSAECQTGTGQQESVELDAIDTFKWASLCHKLKQLREEKHLSQQEVAESCGLQEGRIQEIETAYSSPKPDELCCIADALEVRITELLPFSEEEEAGISRLYKERQKWLDECKNKVDEATSEMVLGSTMSLLEEYVTSVAARIRGREAIMRGNTYEAKRRRGG